MYVGSGTLVCSTYVLACRIWYVKAPVQSLARLAIFRAATGNLEQ